MAASRTLAGRICTRRTVATTSVAALAALLLLTDIPSGIMPFRGGSAALAELIARSPGMRVGGVALKAKQRRAALTPVASNASPAEAVSPGNPVASVLGAAAPEGPLPSSLPGGFPSDFLAPGIPALIAGTPASAGPGTSVPVFETVPFPSGGGGAIFVPGGGGGGGGPGGTIPGDGGTVVPPPPPVAGPVPEPSTWFMMILGLGFVGGTMRRRLRAAAA